MFSLARKNTAYIFYAALRQQADTKLFKSTPTLAAGDFKVSIDGAAAANLATLPTVTPAGGVRIKVSLSAAEMNGDNICVVASDAAGAEWCDEVWNIQTETQATLLQAFLQGLRVFTRDGFTDLSTSLSTQITEVRQAVADLQQSLLRGRRE